MISWKKDKIYWSSVDKQKLEEFVQNEVHKRSINVKIASIFFGTVSFCIFVDAVIVYIFSKFGMSVREENFLYVVLWVATSLCMTLSVVASYFLVKKIFEPMKELSSASLEVAKGNFDVQVQYGGNLEELGNTIENFNRMVRELDSVEIMRNDFVADVSHEFKTPLAAIAGYATFLQDPELTEQERDDYIRKIHFNVDKLNELTENILRLSKLEHQQFLDEPIYYRLDEQLREAIVLLEPKWGKKNMEFELELPEIYYTGQKSLLLQVWMNLIGNAVKYTDEGGKIKVVLEETEQFHKITVKDNGIGMTEETMSHIFDKFYQGDTSHKSQGNGLGLALCKEIIAKCKGSIFVESVIGEGSSFEVYLPEILNKV